MKHSSNTSAYSVIIALFVMSFLLVLTTGVFRLVLSELVQNRWTNGYIQAYAGAVSARELALLHIKQQWYGSYDAINHSIGKRSILLSENPNDQSLFKQNRDVLISYDLWYKVNSYEGNLEKFWYDIIPLFSDDINIDDIVLEVSSWEANKVLWNIIADNWWLAGSGPLNNLSRGKQKLLASNNVVSFWDISVQEFLEQSIVEDTDRNYLFIFNGWGQQLDYILSSWNDKFFTAPKTQIISSGQVWKYRQNLQTSLDNTQFLGILRYSVFSPTISSWPLQ